MTVEERADELIVDFGYDLALKAVQHLSVRDKQWITKLSKEDPANWSLSDMLKIDGIYDPLLREIQERKFKDNSWSRSVPVKGSHTEPYKPHTYTPPPEQPKTKVKVNNEPTPL